MKLILILTTFIVAMIGGLLFSYACSVNPGLHKLPDTDYLRAMQEINRAILNPWFFLCFIGPLILYPASAWLVYRSEGANMLFWMVCVSGAIYLLGVVIVTGTQNVPLNEALDKIVLSAGSKEVIADYRKVFEAPWNSFHMVRTVASMISLVLMLVALVRVR
ncbi:MAG: DUF1772 domain-containing protein [Chryseolinea sp.]